MAMHFKQSLHFMLKRVVLTVLLMALVQTSLPIPAANAADTDRVIHSQSVTIDAQSYPFFNPAAWDAARLVTYNGYQYTAYWDYDGTLALGRRKLSDDSVEVYRFTGTKITAADNKNNHRNSAVGISPGDGTLHISFGNHADQHRYIVSVTDFITNPPATMNAGHFSAERSGMLSDTSLESMSTYPLFIQDVSDNNALYFMNRQGASGDGDWYLNKYDPATHTWSRVSMVFGREGRFADYYSSPKRSVYPNDVLFDSGGNLHISYTNREGASNAGTSIDSQHGLFYVYSADKGLTWRNSDGVLVGDVNNAITIGSPTRVMVEPNYMDLLNVQGMTLDGDGQPHIIALRKYDMNNPESTILAYHYWRTTDGKWHSQRINTVNPDYSPGVQRASIVYDETNNSIYAFFAAGNRGSTYNTLYAAQAAASDDWHTWTIYNISGGAVAFGDGSRFDLLRWNQSRIVSFAVVEGNEYSSLAYRVREFTFGNHGVPAAPVMQTPMIEDRQITVRWSSSYGAESYDLYRKSAIGSYTRIASDLGYGSVATSYTDSNVTVGTEYQYKVTAKNSAGASGYSNERSATALDEVYAYLWEFENDHDTEGWLKSASTGDSNGPASISVLSGSLHVNIKNDSQYIQSPDHLGIAAAEYGYLRFKISAARTPDTAYTVQWTTTADPAWDSHKSLSFTYGGYKDVSADLSASPYWTGTIKQVRIFLATSAEVTNEYVALPYIGISKLSDVIVDTPVPTPTPASPSYTVYASADTHVRDGSYANDNYGSDTNLQVKNDGDGFKRKAALQFDFDSYDKSAVASATLRLYLSATGNADKTLTLYGHTADTWSENGATWNTGFPAGGTEIGSVAVGNTAGEWVEWDVSSYVNAQLSDKKVSFTIAATSAEDSEGICWFSSREANDHNPRLVLVKPPVPAEFTLNPAADSYIRDGTYSGTNYGTESVLKQSGNETADNNMTSVLKFDFSSQGSVAAETRKVLRLYVNQVSSSEVKKISVYGMDDSHWSETDMAWDNADRGRTYIDTVEIEDSGRWYEWNVTDYVYKHSADRVVSFSLLEEPGAGGAANEQISFNSREASSNKPELQFTTEIYELKDRKRPATVASGKPLAQYTASSYIPGKEPWKAFEDLLRGWQPNRSGNAAGEWLKVDFGENVTIDWAGIVQAPGLGGMMTGYKIQSSNDNVKWIDLTEGTGKEVEKTFLAVNARYYRLYITSSINAPYISEFHLSYTGLGTGTLAQTPSDIVKSFNPTADSYVRDGAYARDNYGTENNLQVKRDNTDFNRKSFLTFSFDASSATVAKSAKLRLYAYSMGTQASKTLTLYGSDNASWKETGIYYDLSPASDTEISSLNVGAAGWYEWDVTDYVNKHMREKVVTFVVESTGEPNAEGSVVFYSREAASNRPTLVLTTQ